MVYCLDAATGQPALEATTPKATSGARRSSPTGSVYRQRKRRAARVRGVEAEKELARSTATAGDLSSAVAANGALFVATGQQLYSRLEGKGHERRKGTTSWHGLPARDFAEESRAGARARDKPTRSPAQHVLARGRVRSPRRRLLDGLPGGAGGRSAQGAVRPQRFLLRVRDSGNKFLEPPVTPSTPSACSSAPNQATPPPTSAGACRRPRRETLPRVRPRLERRRRVQGVARPRTERGGVSRRGDSPVPKARVPYKWESGSWTWSPEP